MGILPQSDTKRGDNIPVWDSKVQKYPEENRDMAGTQLGEEENEGLKMGWDDTVRVCESCGVGVKMVFRIGSEFW